MATDTTKISIVTQEMFDRIQIRNIKDSIDLLPPYGYPYGIYSPETVLFFEGTVRLPMQQGPLPATTIVALCPEILGIDEWTAFLTKNGLSQETCFVTQCLLTVSDLVPTRYLATPTTISTLTPTVPLTRAKTSVMVLEKNQTEFLYKQETTEIMQVLGEGMNTIREIKPSNCVRSVAKAAIQAGNQKAKQWAWEQMNQTQMSSPSKRIVGWGYPSPTTLKTKEDQEHALKTALGMATILKPQGTSRTVNPTDGISFFINKENSQDTIEIEYLEPTMNVNCQTTMVKRKTSAIAILVLLRHDLVDTQYPYFEVPTTELILQFMIQRLGPLEPVIETFFYEIKQNKTSQDQDHPKRISYEYTIPVTESNKPIVFIPSIFSIQYEHATTDLGASQTMTYPLLQRKYPFAVIYLQTTRVTIGCPQGDCKNVSVCRLDSTSFEEKRSQVPFTSLVSDKNAITATYPYLFHVKTVTESLEALKGVDLKWDSEKATIVDTASNSNKGIYVVLDSNKDTITFSKGTDNGITSVYQEKLSKSNVFTQAIYLIQNTGNTPIKVTITQELTLELISALEK